MTSTPSIGSRFCRVAGVSVAAFATLGLVVPMSAGATPIDPTGTVTGTRVTAQPAVDVGTNVRNSFGVGFADAFGPDTDDAVSQFVFIEAPTGMTDANHDESEVRTYCVEIGDPFVTPVGGYSAVGVSDATDGGAEKQQRLRAASFMATHATFYDDATGGIIGTTGLSGPDSASGETDGAWGSLRFSTADGFTNDMLNDAEASAVQLAIWNLVGNRDISTAVNASIMNRALELVSIARGDDGVFNTADDRLDPIAPHAYTLDINSADAADTALSTLTVSMVSVAEVAVADVTSPVAGIDVTVTATGIDLDPDTAGAQETINVTTDATGSAVIVATKSTTAATTATAQTTNLRLAPGTLLDTDDASFQQVITAEYETILRAAATNLPMQVPPTTVPATTVPATNVPPVTAPPETTVPVTPAPTTPAEPETTTPAAPSPPRTYQ